MPFRKFYNMIVKTLQQWFKINGKNAFGCPLRLGLYLKVECMNLSETNFSRTTDLSSYGKCHLPYLNLPIQQTLAAITKTTTDILY